MQSNLVDFSQSWVASWTASAQGPYPIGNPSAQPDLRFAFPEAEGGASDQSFRMIVRPDVWGRRARFRLSNVFGTKAVTFDGVYVGLQQSGSAVMTGTNVPVTFGGRRSVAVAAGEMVMSDAVSLAWADGSPWLSGRKLAVSFHVSGDSGRVTWHAKALTTSYLSAPGAVSRGAEEDEGAFPFSTTSWYFLDEVDMAVPGAKTVVALGDSLTDGTGSTLNGDDRWPDVLSRRVHAAFPDRYSVVNAGIGGNRVIGPDDYGANPIPGGPSALDRLERDVAGLPNLGVVIWLEGTNDIGRVGVGPAKVVEAIRNGVALLRARCSSVRVFGATLPPSLNSPHVSFGTAAVDESRRAFNALVMSADFFDGVIDFATVMTDPLTGELKALYQPNTTIGGPGDKLHPNRVGYIAMGAAIDLAQVLGR
ncbi:MAG: GDSL-type esterase/lipase family protein [Telmatospirillum sp.]|nr:GDSL-type esterase/lipase family protein [Telmatospirillum sp.]